MDAVGIVEGEVRELIRTRGLDPQRQPAEVRRLVDEALRDYDERSLLGRLPPLGQLEQVRRRVLDSVAGFGPLQPLLDDPDVEEIWINSQWRRISPSQRRIDGCESAYGPHEPA